MKNVGFGVSLALIILVVVIGIITIGNKDIRETDSNEALATTVDAVLDNMTLSEKYTIKNNEEFVADFTQSLIQEISTGKNGDDKNLSIKVDIMNVDLEKGLLSLRITETYTHPNNKVGKIQYETTVVLEQSTSFEEKTIVFMANGRVYRQFGVMQGGPMPNPGVPQHETNDVKDWDKDFSGWALTQDGDPIISTDEDITKLTVTNDVTYYATWDAHKHQAEFVGTKDVHTKCKECGEIMSTTHKYTSKVTKSPTCIATGIMTYTCECGYEYTKTMAATGHSGDTKTGTVTRTANCTQTGQRYKRCTVCGADYGTPYDYANALGHTGDSGNGAITQYATCTQGGYRWLGCTRCGASYGYTYQYQDPLGHYCSNWWVGNLYNASYHCYGYCDRCSCEMNSQTEAGNTAHSVRNVRVNHLLGAYMYVDTCSGCAYTDTGTHYGWSNYGYWQICRCNQKFFNHRCVRKYLYIGDVWQWRYEWDAWCSNCGARGSVRESNLPFYE